MATVEAYDPIDTISRLETWLSDGKTLRSFCRQPGNPSKSTIYQMIEGLGASIAGRIARARDEGHDAIAEECLEIADSAEDANKGKLQVWTRLQLLAKWNPRKYGEKLDLNHGGAVGVQLVSDIPRPERK